MRQAITILIASLALAILASDPNAYAAPVECKGAQDLVLTNGRFVTMDAANTVASAVIIRNGRFLAIHAKAPPRDPCAQTIDLHGRTVIPGLIDNHVHFLRLGDTPGYELRVLETAFSIADVQAVIRRISIDVPPGQFMTAVGGMHPNQFAEHRLPNLAELDAADSDHPVYLQIGVAGPSVTNSLGRAFFIAHGVVVSDDGSIAAGVATNAAYQALKAEQTLEDRKRGTRYAMDYATSVGLTTVMDMAGPLVGGTGYLDPVTAYDALLDLWREHKASLRLRIYFPSLDTEPGNVDLKARLDKTFSGFGDDVFRLSAVGEYLVAPNLAALAPQSPLYLAAARLTAQRGWTHTQHSLSLATDRAITDVWEQVNAETPIADLHWSLAHVPNIDQATIDRLKAMGAGVALHGIRYLAGTTTLNGPPYRMIVDSGIHAGAGSDATRVTVFNPWLVIYYMVTGKNSSGELINPGQTLTRLEALRLYTAANGWFSREEKELGSIEVGKFADLAVLSANYLEPASVSDDDIRRLSSVLTIVGGEIVHSTLKNQR